MMDILCVLLEAQINIMINWSLVLCLWVTGRADLNEKKGLREFLKVLFS